MGRILLAIGALILAAGHPADGSVPLRPGPAIALQTTKNVRTVSLVWRDRSDFGRRGVAEDSLAAGDGRIFYLQGGALVAATLASGRRLWRYGSGLEGPLTYAGGTVYMVERASQVVALAAPTGRPRWRVDTGLKRINQLRAYGELVLANSYWDGGVALHARTGETRWRLREEGSLGPVAVARGMVYWELSQGEPHFPHVLAVDLRTGRRLWRASHTHTPLAIEGDRVYLSDTWVWTQLDDPDNVQIRVINRRTGKHLARWEYRADFTCGDQIQWRTDAILQGRYLYVAESCGNRVARFPRGGARRPLRRYITFDSGKWIGGPYRGLLFFETAHHHLLGVHLDGGRPERIRGAIMATGRPRSYQTSGASIVRLDLEGRYVYVGRRDGWFHLLDLGSGKRLAAIRAARAFGSEAEEFAPPLRSGDYILVHPQGEVLILYAPE